MILKVLVDAGYELQTKLQKYNAETFQKAWLDEKQIAHLPPKVTRLFDTRVSLISTSLKKAFILHQMDIKTSLYLF